MAELGPKPEIINAAVNQAMAAAKAGTPGSGIWDVVRNMGQGPLTIINTSNPEVHTSAFDPTNLPSDLMPPQAIASIQSNKGPVMVAYTARNVGTLLPEELKGRAIEQVVPAWEVATIASKEPYAGLVIDPGSANAIMIPAGFLGAGLPTGMVNTQAKAILSNPNLATNPAETEARKALVTTIATGPVFTAIERAAYEANQETKFPLIPVGGADDLNEDGTPKPDAAAALVFGTSPAEILAVFDPAQWVPMPVRMNDVVTTVRKTANVARIVINPKGPTLQLPITDQMPLPEPGTPVFANDVANEPTPEPGPSTEPDAGTREGED